jgi:nucleoside-diphosphate-sugar epimerase
MNSYLIVGAGPVGSGVAEQLLARGDEVTTVTRSGNGPEGVRVAALDATDAEALAALAQGCTAIFNCANPAYHRWAIDWPPLAASILTAAERSGAVLVTASNLYGYGPVERPMTQDLPLNCTTVKGRIRAQMWLDALAAHDAGRLRAAEVRGADYVGAGEQSQIDRQLPALLAGKKLRTLGNPDVPHSWTYVGDMARTLVAVADSPEAWGRPWHALVASDDSQREVFTQLAELASLASPALAPVPMWQLKILGRFNKTVGELPEVAYQVEGPFVCDDSATREALGLAPTEWVEVLQRSLAAAAR